jgi:hypothetical protein
MFTLHLEIHFFHEVMKSGAKPSDSKASKITFNPLLEKVEQNRAIVKRAKSLFIWLHLS